MKLQDHLYNEIILSIALFSLIPYFSTMSQLSGVSDFVFFFLMSSPGLILGILLKPNKYWYVVTWILLITIIDYQFNFSIFKNLLQSEGCIEKLEWLVSNILLLFLFGYFGIISGYILRKKIKKEKKTINGYNSVILFYVLCTSFLAGIFAGSEISSNNSTFFSTIIALLIYFFPGFIYYVLFKKTSAWFFVGSMCIIMTISLSVELAALSDTMPFERYIEKTISQIPIAITMTVLGLSLGHIYKNTRVQ